MKTFNRHFKIVLAVMAVLVMVAAFAACDPKDPEPTPDPTTPTTKVTIAIGEAASTITKGETINLTVTVENADDQTYTWTTSPADILKVENNQVSVIADIKVDKYVTITATSNADKQVSASKTILVKAPVVEGQVGELTSAMIQALGNSNITVIGTVEDIYTDLNNSSNNYTNAYNSTVKMADGAWNGSFSVKGEINGNTIYNFYRKGETDGVKNASGDIGHALETLYIDKNNEVARTAVKDYQSIPAVWEMQHMWNHIGNLDITKFTYDAKKELYQYNADLNDEDDAYLMTYLAYSLTPMLEETFASLYFKIESGEITKLIAQTDIVYYGDEDDPDALFYTTAELNFSDIGTTETEEPAKYDAPDYVAKLEAAISKIASANNYTYKVKDMTTYAAQSDSSDYELSSSASAADDSATSTIANYKSSVGTVGEIGYVTNGAILVAKTGKYSYSMDDKLYHTEYYGYKQVTEGYYDEFEYSYNDKVLYGTKRINGNVLDSLPDFDFSANIFSFAGSNVSATGKTTYTFKLRSGAITRDVAMEISSYSYAKNGTESLTKALTIVVDDEGNIVSTTFPYEFTAYAGYCETTYSDIGNTTITDGAFNGYIAREWKSKWSNHTTKYFDPEHDGGSTAADTETVLKHIYGDDISNLPDPEVFLNIFGDNLYGPFFNSRSKGEVDGVKTYADYISFNTESLEYDENNVVTNYEEIMNKIDVALTALGFELSKANTDMTGGTSGRSDRIACYIKGNVQIVITNNFTKNFSIYFYKTGDWTLNR